MIEPLWFDHRTEFRAGHGSRQGVAPHRRAARRAGRPDGHPTREDRQAPSLCEGWRVRDVGAHLTQAQLGMLPALVAVVRARGKLNRMIHDTAVRQARLPVEEYPGRIRAMLGSRRTAPGVSMIEPLTDALVHGQDIVRALGRERSMPAEAAATSAQRVWSMSFPFHARKRLAGFELVATDHSWRAGQGLAVEAPVADLLLLLTDETWRFRTSTDREPRSSGSSWPSPGQLTTTVCSRPGPTPTAQNGDAGDLLERLDVALRVLGQVLERRGSRRCPRPTRRGTRRPAWRCGTRSGSSASRRGGRRRRRRPRTPAPAPRWRARRAWS